MSAKSTVTMRRSSVETAIGIRSVPRSLRARNDSCYVSGRAADQERPETNEDRSEPSRAPHPGQASDPEQPRPREDPVERLPDAGGGDAVEGDEGRRDGVFRRWVDRVLTDQRCGCEREDDRRQRAHDQVEDPGEREEIDARL